MNDTQIIVYVDHDIYRWANDDVSILTLDAWDRDAVNAWLTMIRPDRFDPETTPDEVHARRMTWGAWGDEESVVALRVP